MSFWNNLRCEPVWSVSLYWHNNFLSLLRIFYTNLVLFLLQNIVSEKIQTKWSPNRPRAPKCPLRCIKAHSFYMDRGLRKGTITNIEEKVPPSMKVKNKPLIPSREEYLTTAEVSISFSRGGATTVGCSRSTSGINIQWLTKYGLEKLQLGFTYLMPTGKHRRSYKHIGNKVRCDLYIGQLLTH